MCQNGDKGKVKENGEVSEYRKKKKISVERTVNRKQREAVATDGGD